MIKMHVVKAGVDMIYPPCQDCGRGLMNLGKEYTAAMAGIQKYMTQKEDIHVEALLKHKGSKAPYSRIKEAEKYLSEAGATDDVSEQHPNTTT